MVGVVREGLLSVLLVFYLCRKAIPDGNAICKDDTVHDCAHGVPRQWSGT